jgi:hypothetical protein
MNVANKASLVIIFLQKSVSVNIILTNLVYVADEIILSQFLSLFDPR